MLFPPCSPLGRQGKNIVSRGGEEGKPSFFFSAGDHGEPQRGGELGSPLGTHSLQEPWGEEINILNFSVLTYEIMSTLPQCRRLTELTRRWTLSSLHDTLERFLKELGEK